MNGRFQQWLERLAARGTTVLVATGAAMFVAYLTATLMFPKATGRVLFGDATHHFVQLHSIVFDRDLHFQNEYARIYESNGGEPQLDWIYTDLTETGHVRNYMPVGPAIFWAPLYLLVLGVQWLMAMATHGVPPDGFGRAAQIVPGVTGIIAATAAAWLAWRVACRFADRGAALAATIAVWLGSHAIYYSMVSPSYSHAVSMFTGALFVAYWFLDQSATPIRRAAVLGALAGAATLVRWQDVVFLLVPIFELALGRSPWTTRVAGILAAGLAWVVVFSPQMIVWHVLYGQAFAIPQGPSFMQWTTPHPIDVLFSTNHGLLTWAPLLILSLAGLWTLAGRERRLSVSLAVVLLVSWYVNAAVADWWAGEAFGARRFLSCFPLFVVGLSIWLDGDRRTRRQHLARLAAVAVLVGMNGLLLLQYQLFMKGLTDVAPYPSGWFDMWVARFVVPVRLLAWWQG
jgi:hypothetical protein